MTEGFPHPLEPLLEVKGQDIVAHVADGGNANSELTKLAKIPAATATNPAGYRILGMTGIPTDEESCVSFGPPRTKDWSTASPVCLSLGLAN